MLIKFFNIQDFKKSDELLHLIKKSTDLIIKETKARLQVTSEFELTNSMTTFLLTTLLKREEGK